MDKATGEMPFLDHLEELRSRLFKVLGAAVVGIGIGLWAVLRFNAIAFLARPIAPYLTDTNGKLTILGVTDQFLITLKLGAVVGLVLASPIILYQLWAFLSPALYARERKAMIPALFVGLLLFMAGVAAGWLFVLPKAIPIMLGFQQDAFNLSITYDRYFPFVIQILLALGISAEVPLVMILLAALGIFDAKRYNAFRRYAVLLSFIGGAFMSPGGDVFLMLLLTMPLLLLYEIGVAGSYLVQRRRRLGPGIGAAAAVLVLVGVAGPAPLAAQDRPPIGVGQQADSLRGRRPGEARQMDSATAKRLGLPTGPSRPFAGPDSVMEALLRRRGFAVTRYLGDTAILFADSQRILLTGKAATERDGAILEAERIIYADAACELVATGEPRMFEEGKIAIGRTLRFDTCGERGVFDDAFTTFDELGDNWFVRGNLAVDSSASRLYASSSEFTSCDLPLPHYEFRAGKVKWVSQSYLVARPAVLYIRDVPVAWLPFLFQDTKPGRRSGILIPQFGFNDIVRPTRGYNRQITNIGYYWAPNDYLDATFRLDWLSSRYVQFGGEFNYAWRNRFVNGGIALNRQIEVEGSSSTQLMWQHQQAFSAASQVNFTLNYVTDSRVMAGNAIDPLLSTQQISSAANFTRRFAWGNVTLGGTRRQNVTDGSGTMTLPSLTITPSPIAIGRHLSWSPTFRAVNDVGFKTPLSPQLVVGGGVIDTVLATGSSRSSQLNFDTPLTIGGFTWSNRVSYSDRMITARTLSTRREPDLNTPDPNDSTTFSTIRGGSFDSAINWETGINLPPMLRSTLKLQPTITVRNIVSSAPYLIRNTETNGEWVQQGKRVEASLTARPDLFGRLGLGGFGPYQAIRHQFSPSISIAWSPEATVPEAFARALAATRTSGAVQPPRMLLTVGLTQNFQGKPRAPAGDTTTDPRGIRPVSLLSLSTSQFGYDFEQEKLEGRTGYITQTLTNQIQSELVQGLTLSLTHDLWKGQVGTDTATFDPFLQSVNANFTLTDRTFRSLLSLVGLASAPGDRRNPADTAAAQYTRQSDPRFRPGSFGAGTPVMGSRQRGFTASVSYSLSRQRTPGSVLLPPIDPDDPFGGLPLPVAPFQGNRSSVSLNMSFAPTTFWSVRWNTQYNITDGRFESHQLQLERDLHDWRAGFNFVRNANGNFALYFNVFLLSLPDIKFDYNQTTLQP